MKYHIHIYKVAKMMEIDIDAKDSSEAKNKAYEHMKDHKWRRADCKQLSLDYSHSECVHNKHVKKDN